MKITEEIVYRVYESENRDYAYECEDIEDAIEYAERHFENTPGAFVQKFQRNNGEYDADEVVWESQQTCSWIEIERVETVSETKKVILKDGWYVLVVPREDKAGWYDLWMMIEPIGGLVDGSYMAGIQADSWSDVLDVIERESGKHFDKRVGKMQEALDHAD